MKTNDVDINDVLHHKIIQTINPYNLGRFNKSTYFLLPIFGYYIGTNMLFNNLLVNLYLNDDQHENLYRKPIFFLFRTKSFLDRDWLELQKLLKKPVFLDTYLNEYYLGFEKKDGVYSHLYVYVYQCPKEWEKEYVYFKLGQYSRFSQEYKKKFPKEARSGGKIVESKIYGAINKTSSLKDYLIKEFNVDVKEEENFRKMLNNCDELWDGPKLEEEILNYKK